MSVPRIAEIIENESLRHLNSESKIFALHYRGSIAGNGTIEYAGLIPDCKIEFLPSYIICDRDWVEY